MLITQRTGCVFHQPLATWSLQWPCHSTHGPGVVSKSKWPFLGLSIWEFPLQTSLQTHRRWRNKNACQAKDSLSFFESPKRRNPKNVKAARKDKWSKDIYTNFCSSLDDSEMIESRPQIHLFSDFGLREYTPKFTAKLNYLNLTIVSALKKSVFNTQ